MPADMPFDHGLAVTALAAATTHSGGAERAASARISEVTVMLTRPRKSDVRQQTSQETQTTITRKANAPTQPTLASTTGMLTKAEHETLEDQCI